MRDDREKKEMRKLFFCALTLVFFFGITTTAFGSGTGGSMTDDSATPPPAIYPHTIGEIGDTIITDTSGREWKLSKPILGTKEINPSWTDGAVTAYVVSWDTRVTTPTLDMIIAAGDYEMSPESLGIGSIDAGSFDIPYEYGTVGVGILYLGGSMLDTTTGVHFYGVKEGWTPEQSPATPAPAANVAKPTASTVFVNGKNIVFDAYNIGGNNYFKLRDLAHALNGTEKQFDVGYDTTTKVITLTSGVAYTEVGGEMESKGASDKTPTATTSKITLDGANVSFDAYNIGGNNYFKLRDIGAAFDFGVDWDGAKNAIVIDTSKGYAPE
jgi:hypothetical protein